MYSKKVSIVGTHGIPAKYGGFETLAENLTSNLSSKHSFTVYCNSSIYNKSEMINNKNDITLIYLPFNASGWQAYLYDAFSLIHAFFKADTIIYLGPTFGFLISLNFFFKKNIITNYGGLNEWDRPKYNFFQNLLIKLNYKFSLKYSSHNVVDNSELQKSLKTVFKADSKIIKYGGNHFEKNNISNENNFNAKYPFVIKKYYLCVARAQHDSNLHLLIDTFIEYDLKYPLVIISNWNISSYGKKLKYKFCNSLKVILLDAIYDKIELNFIRRNSYLYIHSHSFCGTAPSLVEAMCMELPIVCYDVLTNRETTDNKSIYFKSSNDLANILMSLNSQKIYKIKLDLTLLAKSSYDWKIICNMYNKLI